MSGNRGGKRGTEKKTSYHNIAANDVDLVGLELSKLSLVELLDSFDLVAF